MRGDPLVDEDVLRTTFAALGTTAPAAETTDLAAAGAAWATRAEHLERLRRRRFRPLVLAPMVAAAAVVVLALVVAWAPPRLLGLPGPASPPSGSGALPDRLFMPPLDVPSVLDAPISRVAYVVGDLGGAIIDTATGERQPVGPRGIVLVGADGGEYRTVPTEAAARVTLSADGTALAWVQAEDAGKGPTTVRLLDVPNGRYDDVEVDSDSGTGVLVDRLVFAPDRGAVYAQVHAYDTSGAAADAAQVVRVRWDGVVEKVCDCSGFAGVTASGDVAVTEGFGPSGTVRAPDLPTTAFGAYQGAGMADGPTDLLSPDGVRRFAVETPEPFSDTNTAALQEQPMSLVSRVVDGPQPAVALGDVVQGRVIAATDAGALVVTARKVETMTWAFAGPRQVRFVTPDGAGAPVTSIDDTTLDVLLAASDVVAGGRTTPGVRATAPDRTDLLHWRGVLRRAVG